ncbi:hypothetical protein [Halalkalicoccus salilacus]|uniref:hypothetical protein n=1 Tax=Halalkalicoccus salilacus TaxID=3117459 RepID=UPI00300F0C7D
MGVNAILIDSRLDGRFFKFVESPLETSFPLSNGIDVLPELTMLGEAFIAFLSIDVRTRSDR